MYLDYVPLWSDDGCITAETCCLEVNHRVFTYLLKLYVVFVDGNKIPLRKQTEVSFITRTQYFRL